MSAQPILASLVASLDAFKKHPLELLRSCGDAPVAVLDDNQPVFYVLLPEAWAALQQTRGQSPADTTAASRFNRFEALAGQMLILEEQRVARGDLSRASLGIVRNRLNAHVMPFFRFVQPSQTTVDVLEKFVQRLQDAGLSNTTVSQYLVIVRKLLKLAIRHGVLAQMPEWPSVRIVNRPRTMLSLREYALLVRAAHRLSRTASTAPEIKERHGAREKFWVLPRHRTLPPDMAWAMRFMVNCFLRPGDLRQLRHKHVEVCRGNGTLYLRLTLPDTKRHDTPVVSMRAAVHVYETVRARAQAQRTMCFCPRKKTATTRSRWWAFGSSG